MILRLVTGVVFYVKRVSQARLELSRSHRSEFVCLLSMLNLMGFAFSNSESHLLRLGWQLISSSVLRSTELDADMFCLHIGQLALRKMERKKRRKKSMQKVVGAVYSVTLSLPFDLLVELSDVTAFHFCQFYFSHLGVFLVSFSHSAQVNCSYSYISVSFLTAAASAPRAKPSPSRFIGLRWIGPSTPATEE